MCALGCGNHTRAQAARPMPPSTPLLWPPPAPQASKQASKAAPPRSAAYCHSFYSLSLTALQRLDHDLPLLARRQRLNQLLHRACAVRVERHVHELPAVRAPLQHLRVCVGRGGSSCVRALIYVRVQCVTRTCTRMHIPRCLLQPPYAAAHRPRNLLPPNTCVRTHTHTHTRAPPAAAAPSTAPAAFGTGSCQRGPPARTHTRGSVCVSVYVCAMRVQTMGAGAWPPSKAPPDPPSLPKS